MAHFTPSRFSRVKELLEQLRIHVELDAEMTAILEEMFQRMYAVDEDNKRLTATVRVQEGKIASLEKRYSELLFKFSEFKQSSPK